MNTTQRFPDSAPFPILIATPDAGLRLDACVSAHAPDFSRSHAAKLIRQGLIRVNAIVKKPGYRVKPGDLIEGRIPEPEAVSYGPEALDLDILYEDSAIIVINKPPGMVVHPAPGHYSGTLVNGLLHHCPDLAPIAGEIRPGIVHRLDKDTSGTLIAAKNAAVLGHLAGQFKARTVQKTYLTVVYGNLRVDSGEIDLPVGRHPTDRKKMSTRSRRPRQALTRWKVKARFPACSFLEVELMTGRTHQIRVHFASGGHPVIGDALYGGHTGRQYQRHDPQLASLVKDVGRQMLHAWQLTVAHPETGVRQTFESPLPEDMQALLTGLGYPVPQPLEY